MKLGERRKKGDFFFKQKSPHLGASVVLSPHPSATPGGSGGLGEGSGSGCRTGKDADLGGGAPSSLALADLEMGVAAGIPMPSERPLCCGGEEEKDLSETSMLRSPSSMSTLWTSTWRSFRWRVSLGGARRSRLPARPPGWTREVDARAGDDGVEAEEDRVTDERWNADLERFHQDGIVTAAGGEEEEGRRNPSRRARRVNGIGGGRDARVGRGAGGRRRRRPRPRRRPPPFWVGRCGRFFYYYFFVVLFGRRSLLSRVPLGWPTCHADAATTKVQPVKPHIAFLVLKKF